jgi:DtxR family Mn-dependent transcriptional regulator
MFQNSSQEKDQLIPLVLCLTDCERDTELTVISISAGFQAKRRLADLGILPGVKIVKKRTAPLRGPIEIIVKGTAIVIGRGLASKIMVKCQKPCKL